MRGTRSVPSGGPIVPREGGAAPLDFVIAVMAFLAALALGASLIADRTAQTWQSGLAGRLTVQILPPETGNAPPGQAKDALAKETAAALAVLETTPGIARAHALSQDQLTALVAPWIGKGEMAADIPLPQLIDAVLVPGAGIDIPALHARLEKAVPGATLDDHSRWIARLAGLAGAVRYSAYAVLLLIAGATAAAVSFATRAGLAAHHETVELLHRMGALSTFIARTVERRYCVSALAAACAGTLLAAALFLILGSLERAGVGAVPFLPPLSLGWREVPWLLPVPAAVALIAWATARLSVLSVIRTIY